MHMVVNREVSSEATYLSCLSSSASTETAIPRRTQPFHKYLHFKLAANYELSEPMEIGLR